MSNSAATSRTTRDHNAHGTGSAPPHLEGSSIQSHTIDDWTARIRVEEREVGMPFSVLLFLGRVPEDPAYWQTSSALVGVHYVFVDDSSTQSKSTQGSVTEGFVHLNRALAKMQVEASLGSFEPHVVVPILKRELQWRVQKVCSQYAIEQGEALMNFQ